MSKTMKNFLVVLAIALCFISVQNVYAQDAVIVTGVITATSTNPNMVVLDDVTEVYGIKFNYLCRQYGICDLEGKSVTITAHEYLCSDGSIKLMATGIEVDGESIYLRP